MKTHSYTRFFILLGPWLALLLFSIWLMREGVYFPALALIALPLCCCYRFWGLLGSLSLLGAVAALSYFEAPLQERIWIVGGAMAMALTFVVTTLSCEEAEESFRHLKAESNSRLTQLRNLDESMRSEVRKSQMECKELEAKVAYLEKSLSKLQN